MSAGPGQVTIGIAIAVPEPLATSLKEARLSYGDLQAETIPTHVTILPPTIVDQDVMPLIREHLRQIAQDTVPFVIELLGTDSFRPVSPVVFVPLVRVGPAPASPPGCAAARWPATWISRITRT